MLPLLLRVVCIAIGFGIVVEMMMMMLVEVSQFSITVIVIACGCATGLATTTATCSSIYSSGFFGTTSDAMASLGFMTGAVVVVMIVRHARLLKLDAVPVRLQVLMGMLLLRACTAFGNIVHVCAHTRATGQLGRACGHRSGIIHGVGRSMSVLRWGKMLMLMMGVITWVMQM